MFIVFICLCKMMDLVGRLLGLVVSEGVMLYVFRFNFIGVMIVRGKLMIMVL